MFYLLAAPAGSTEGIIHELGVALFLILFGVAAVIAAVKGKLTWTILWEIVSGRRRK